MLIKHGNIITADHIGLKRVPTSCIKYTSKSMNINPMYIYKHLYSQGNHIKFDLTEEVKHCGFMYEKDMKVRPYEEN